MLLGIFRTYFSPTGPLRGREHRLVFASLLRPAVDGVDDVEPLVRVAARPSSFSMHSGSLMLGHLDFISVARQFSQR
jgi:hypothetical protein